MMNKAPIGSLTHLTQTKVCAREESQEKHQAAGTLRFLKSIIVLIQIQTEQKEFL